MPRLTFGVAAPWFSAPTHSNPRFAFSSVAGRFVLVVLLPADTARAQSQIAQILARESLFDASRQMVFFVVRDLAQHAARRETRGVRYFLDADGAVSRAFGALDDAGEQPYAVVLDPSLRTVFTAEPDDYGRLLAFLETLPVPDGHAGVRLHAPVLIVPRIFEPPLCRELIAYYDARGGAPSGVMRQIDGKTVGVLDDFKKRRDATIDDQGLKDRLQHRIFHRLLPEIEKAFQFRATRMERYIVAAYDAEEGGYFRPHRDNTTGGTAHRQFACSINLNAEQFEGGDLRFPEFGTRTYRPPTGGAVVFSCSLLHEATPVVRGAAVRLPAVLLR
ncbi:2OG-Fe(II) oxygenase [Phenylobacterium sp. J367]|uniref:2OG-Fe(II) oxygenase n=1 Tax=Phenylobacterium sp. J367 TaxID=2898435 RepID=UPI002151464F|nr:2OG-Fe(II) oxygenase [Phenylobacterium sp. J367]MCR5878152.1 2OG-Fe(II) oxygenase [Phenylobacterium sp. J367]